MTTDILWNEHELWALREDVSVDIEPGGGPAKFHGPWGDYTVPRLSPLAQDVLFRLSLGPIFLQNALAGKVTHPDADFDELAVILSRIQPLILRSVGTSAGQLLMTVVPLAVKSRFDLKKLAPDRLLRLSRFAVLRGDGASLCMESPLALHRVLLQRAEASGLVLELAAPVTLGALTRARPGAESVTVTMLEYLTAAGMIVVADSEGRFAEDHDPVLSAWSPVDMMFHTRSTLGRHDHNFGLAFTHRECVPPEPVVAPQRSDYVELARPRWDELLSTDPPLTVAIEGRRSVRQAKGTVRLADLGAVLYRVARVRAQVALGDSGAGRKAPRDKRAYELSDRPYPSGGACYELEFYVTVTDCDALAPGTYHYDPLGHRLEPVKGEQGAVEELLGCAQVAAALDAQPPVLISITARFRRLSWKYPGLAYRLVLIHVGVVLQNLYLVCTAMRLGPCAVGSVSIEAAARGLGTDWRTEPCVGQFILGGQSGEEGEPGGGEWRAVNDAVWSDLSRSVLSSQHHLSRREGETA